MAGVLMTVQLDPGAATVEGAATRLGIAPEEIDAEYGVVPVDPEARLYAVLVSEEAGARATGGDGPFSNPSIEPFG